MEWHETRPKEWHEAREELKKIFGFTLPISATLSIVTGKAEIDLFTLEKLFHRANPEFNPDQCTYKGKEGYSTYMFVEERYGKRAKELLESII